jgi:transcription antitermination factor NusG
MSEPAWYCIHTKPKCEHIAAGMLRTLPGIEVFCPRIRFQRSTQRGKVWFVEALFPSYFFARFDLDASLRAVKHSQNVIRVVEFGSTFVTIPDQTIAELREEMQHQDVREVTPELKVGDEVELTEGPMRGFRGIIDAVINGQDRVRILLDFLGRQNVVIVEAGALLNDISPRAALSPR